MGMVYLLCGLATAGKTTLAKKLEKEHDAIRFTLDQRMIEKTNLTIFDEAYGRLVSIEKELIWQEAQQYLTNGQDVILDWSLWSKSARKEWSQKVLEAGYSYKLFFLDVPLDELKQRLVIRNAQNLEFVHVALVEELERFSHIFEPPTVAENLNLEVVRKGDT